MKTKLLRLTCFFTALLALAHEVRAQGTAFTYQGRLNDGANPANGTYDLRFLLFDISSGGSPLSTLNKLAIPVSNGLFTVTLDFGNQFPGADRWLNIGVRTNGGGLFSTLSPRQKITATPYAITAGSLAIPLGMVLIPAGAFTMGDILGDDLIDVSNAPPTIVNVSAFYMDMNEVTLSQWRSVYLWTVVQTTYAFSAGAGKAANHPVQDVTWYDCVKWCNARSEREGKTPVYYTDDAQTMVYRSGDVDLTNAMVKWTANGYRLPTEAEWEKAARGGLSGQRFPWGNVINQNLANYYGSTTYAYDLGPNFYNAIGSIGGTSPATSPVGSFAANGYGLYDMAGNVFEWCWDWYETPYAGGSDPHGPASGSSRVLRGGDWGSYANVARCAYRLNVPGYADYYIGFRCVRGL